MRLAGVYDQPLSDDFRELFRQVLAQLRSSVKSCWCVLEQGNLCVMILVHDHEALNYVHRGIDLALSGGVIPATARSNVTVDPNERTSLTFATYDAVGCSSKRARRLDSISDRPFIGEPSKPTVLPDAPKSSAQAVSRLKSSLLIADLPYEIESG